ncbi:MAG: hypothetical protein E6Q56_05940, partial [Mycobacterium sp.]
IHRSRRNHLHRHGHRPHRLRPGRRSNCRSHRPHRYRPPRPRDRPRRAFPPCQVLLHRRPHRRRRSPGPRATRCSPRRRHRPQVQR